jgi:thiamine-monophosphate kinase
MTNRPSEFELIRQLFAPLSLSLPGAFGLTDDAAVFATPKGDEVVITADAIVEGVHFLKSDPAGTIAKKALRVNLSDLAAKGALPHRYLLVLALPDWPDMAWLEAFAHGLGEDQALFGIALAGGDTTATPGPLTIAITALGFVPEGTMIRRAGARAGDLVFVTGTLGDAGGGLALLKGEGARISEVEKESLIARYRVPTPRLAMGRTLRGLATTALDVSDGLLADLGHIADISRVRIEIDATRIPLSPALRAFWNEEAVLRAATAGDDYEIAFTAPPVLRDAVMEAARLTGTSVTEIGRVVTGQGAVLLDAEGRAIPMACKGYTHF